MSTSLHQTPTNNWKEPEKILFRFFFIYFILQAVPLDWKYLRRLFQIDWLHIQFQDIFNISRYTPQLLPAQQTADFWGIQQFGDWAILAIIALVGTIIWSIVDKKNTQYKAWYYALRVILRYRLAIGVIAYGFIKFFPLQSPYPTLSELNTNYGDLSAWKLFSLSLGVAPSFEIFLGLVEIVAGLLLFSRKTVFLATFIILCFTGNVFMSNLAYEGGEAVYSAYLLQFAFFLLAYDGPRLFRVLSLEKPAYPNSYKPIYSQAWQLQGRRVLKTLFILFFVVLYGVKTYGVYRHGGYKLPVSKGELAQGYYEVSRFVLNGKELPYSKTDPLRWQNVVVEQWPTLSIETGALAQPIVDDIEVVIPDERKRVYEFSGNSGRHFYRYDLDRQRAKLALREPIGEGQPNAYSLKVVGTENGNFSLKGVSVSGDSLEIELNKVDKKYLLEEAKKVGRRSRLVL